MDAELPLRPAQGHDGPTGPGNHQAARLWRLTLWGVALAWGLHLLPYALLWPSPYVRIHDNMEGEWIWLHLLAANDLAWTFSPQAEVPQVMDGLSRWAFPYGFSLPLLLVDVLGSLGGYVATYVLIHLVGLLGMFRLLRDYVLTNAEDRWLALLMAFAFSWVPAYPSFGLAVMGQPWVLWAFLNLRRGWGRWWDWAILLGLPFTASVVWIGPYALLGLGLIWLGSLRQRQPGGQAAWQPQWPRVLALVGMGVGFLVANWPLVMLTVAPPFVSHRVAYDPLLLDGAVLKQVIERFLTQFLTSHYHVGSFIAVPVWVAVGWAMALPQPPRLLGRLVLIILVVGVLYALYPALLAVVPPGSFLTTFRLDRVGILLPMLWLMALGVALHRLWWAPWARGLHRLGVGGLVGSLLVLTLFVNDELLHNVRTLVGAQRFPTYREYLAPELFQDIEEAIRTETGLAQPAYRVISLGLSPTIAQASGFYTLDGLQALYPLDHKQRFRRIIAPELAQDSFLAAYYDNWGNRCYAFSKELGWRQEAFLHSKADDTTRLQTFRLNGAELYQQGGRYVFSAVPLANPGASGLVAWRTFVQPKGWWRVNVYAVAAPGNSEPAPPTEEPYGREQPPQNNRQPQPR